MNAKQLIEQVNECSKNNWQNSDLGKNSEEMLEKMAEHFENCEECRKEFDVQEYPEETLIDFEDELSNTDVYDWICEERPKQQDEVYIEEIDYRNAEGYWKAGKTWEQMKNNEWHDGEKLTLEKIRELQNESPEGFYLVGWRKENEDSEADLYLTPKQTYKEGQ